ncbi:MAG: iron-sulfur cluster assembly scaffold protein [Candidatus Omnitrophica bacterium]|nr:iron-sulfur cluster assembly scaffold protein [Candidatus Omnitrophota bacterium]MDD5670331.1 iron-sulfur cluster assembly scaffold protein [Candidatus Omnitrophota bacterium]
MPELSFSFKKAEKFIDDPSIYGRMNDPDGSSYLQGPCGDVMEFYLTISDDKLAEVKYYSEGCNATRACGAMVARLAVGKTIHEGLNISAGDIMSCLKGLPEDHLHCSILAVSAFYRAIAEYLLKG